MVEKKLNNSFIKKPFLLAVISGIVLVFFSLSFNVFSSFSDIQTIFPIISLILLFACVFFYYGFFVLAKKYNNRLLKRVVLIMIVLGILFYFFILFGDLLFPEQIVGLDNTLKEYNESLIKAGVYNVSDLSNLTLEQQQALNETIFKLDNAFTQEFFSALMPIFILLGVFFLAFIVLSILLGISLISLDSKVKYAKIAGILEIVGASTLIIVIGFPVVIASFVFQMIILVNEAKKSKEIRA